MLVTSHQIVMLYLDRSIKGLLKRGLPTQTSITENLMDECIHRSKDYNN